MAELVDAHDSKSCGVIHESSILSPGTMQKILVILGPTATGKSELAVTLAKKYKGEVISADSRQVYKGLDLGSGKITKNEMGGIAHHLLDVANPKEKFGPDRFKQLCEASIALILSKGKVPILAGGTGYYIQSIVNNMVYPPVPPDIKLRKQLERKTPAELYEILKKADKKRSSTIDKYNKVRLIRAIEIARSMGSVPDLITIPPKYAILEIGIDIDDEELKRRISTRLNERLKKGMIGEVSSLRASGLTWKRLETLGIEYKNISLFLRKKISRDEMKRGIEKETWHYVKRQRTWFKRDKKIKWFHPNELTQICGEIQKFLSH